MMTYDVKCPVCGKMNRNLYLEETDGWMECECCGSTIRQKIHHRSALRPVIGVFEEKKAIPAT